MDTLDGSIVHIILLLLFIGSLIHHLIHQERPMCRGEREGHILINIYTKWKLITMLDISKNLLLLKPGSHLSFLHCPNSQNCSSNHRLYCFTSHSICQPLQSDFVPSPTQPFWNHYFFKISCGLLVPRFKCLFTGLILTYFSETFTR